MPVIYFITSNKFSRPVACLKETFLNCNCLLFSKRSKKGEKNGKGLRHFSMKVCEKVQQKGTTTYNEVADELVAEFSNTNNHESGSDEVRHH